jgi:hypothetical protein
VFIRLPDRTGCLPTTMISVVVSVLYLERLSANGLRVSDVNSNTPDQPLPASQYYRYLVPVIYSAQTNKHASLLRMPSYICAFVGWVGGKNFSALHFYVYAGALLLAGKVILGERYLWCLEF